MTNCKNCAQAITDNFCAHCGLPVKLKRIDKHYIAHEALHLLHFEKGFFYTARGLMTQPGNSIKEFINDNRNKHMKPVAFLILTSLLFTLIAHYFHADTFYNEKEKLNFGKSHVAMLWHWVQTHYGYANIIMGGFIALCVQLFFRKYKYNLFETTVLLCFIMGEGMLLLTIEAFFVGILNEQAYRTILSIIAFAYPTWAIGQFFDKSKVVSYVKALLAYVLGYLFFLAALVAVGLIVDVITKTYAAH